MGALLASGLHRVQISFDSLEEATYRQIRIPAVKSRTYLFETTKQYVEDFIVSNKKMGSPVFISISAVISDLNRHEKQNIHDFWSRAGVDNVYFPEMVVRSGLGGMRPPKVRRRLNRCTMPFRTMGVMWDGNVRMCNGAPNSSYAGNVFTEGFQTVWMQGTMPCRRHVIEENWAALEKENVHCAQCDLNVLMPSLNELGGTPLEKNAVDKFLIRRDRKNMGDRA